MIGSNPQRTTQPLCWVLSAALLLALALPALFSQTGTTLYFYSSETTVSNYVSLKIQFDSYLSQRVNYQFQPFSDRDVFEQILTSKRDGVFLLSSWHFARLRNKLNAEP